MENFNGKKICGKSSKTNMMNAERPDKGDDYCSYGKRLCGGKVCIDANQKCPITNVVLQTSSGNSSDPNIIPLSSGKELKFSTANNEMPLYRVKLEIEKPCMNKYFQSGLANENDSI